MNNRICSIDITRIVAFCSVLCVHFFLNSNFYDEPIIGVEMYSLVIIRNIFMICVPLFMLLTGYLMSDKKIDIAKDYKTHLRKLCPILLTYAIATLMIFIYWHFYLGKELIIKQLLFNILSYSQYSWYVNMYIGLYLLIPFLNVLWSGLDSVKSRRILIVVLFFTTTLPSVINVYDFTTIKTLLLPYTAKSAHQIIPNWWIQIYPITYYYLGAYIKKEVDPLKMNTLKIAALLCASFFLFGLFNIWKSYPNPFVGGAWCDWGSLQNVTNTILVFLFIHSINFDAIPIKIRKLIALISDLTFGAYILSYIPDSIIYPTLNEQSLNMFDKFRHFPVLVGTSIIVSLALSSIIYIIMKTGRLILNKCHN